MASPVWQSQGAASQSSTKTTTALVGPSSTAANDIFIATIYIELNTAITAPSGWTEVTGSNYPLVGSYNGTAIYLRHFWKRLSAAESGATYNFTHSAAWTKGVISRFTGCVTSGTPIYPITFAVQGTPATTTPAVSGTSDSVDLTFYWVGVSGSASGTWSPPTNFTENVDALEISIATRALATGSAAGTSSGSAVGTKSDATTMGAALLGLRAFAPVSVQTISPSGRSSTLAYGSPTVTQTVPGQTISPAGRSTTLAYGAPTVSGGAAPAAASSTADPTNLYKPPQQVDNFTAANPELAPIAAQPQARWVNTQGDADNLPSFISAAGGKTALICIYAIPGRDNGQYSAGGFPDRASYLNFCTTVKNNIGNAPAFIMYEPDALGLTNGMSASVKAERIETLRQGIGILATIPNAETYIDASKWISAAEQANLQQAVDIAKVAGIVMNVSGYDSMDSCYSYGDAVLTELANKGITGKKYIIDSGRNGVGALTDADRPLASPWLDTSQAWCNPPKRRLGPTPQVPSGKANCRALMWIKNPGESDGTFPNTSQSSYYGENAPSAGAFWVAHARDMLGLTPQKSASTGGASRDITTIPNMNGWWKADSLTVANGAAVSSWADNGPGGNTATQSTASAQPVLVTNVLNGKPVVRFTSDRLDTAMSASESAQTIFAVARPTDITRINTIVGATTAGGRQFRFNEEGRIEWLAQAEEGTVKSTTQASTSAFKIATGSITGSGAFNYWMDGAAVGGGSWSRTFSTGRTSHLGHSGSTASEGFIGDIAEIISFNRVLTDSERAQVHSYLQDKYAITTSDYVAASGGGSGSTGAGFSTITADFESSNGAFTNVSGGVSRVSGRLRIPAGASYENASTEYSYTLKESSIFARVYPAPASGATQAPTQFVLAANGAADGTRLLAAIDTVAGTLYAGAEVGYYDANGIRITYDPTAHSVLRWRETGGRTYFDTSPDGQTWTNRGNFATPSYVTTTANMRAQFVVYKDAGTGYAEVDNVNLAGAGGGGGGGGGGATTTRTNLVINPSFENNITDGVGETYGGGTFTRDTTDKVFGNASLKVTVGSGGDTGRIVTYDPIEPGTYTASTYMKTTSDVTNAHFVVRTRPSYGTVGTEVHISGATGWTRRSVTFTITSAGEKIVDILVGLGSYGSTSGGTAWFDGVMVEKASEAGPYFDGSYTETAGRTVAWTGAAHNSTSTETATTSQTISSTLNPTADASASVTGALAQTTSLSATAASSATVAGALSISSTLAASAAAGASVIGDQSSATALSASGSATSSVTGSIATESVLAATADATADDGPARLDISSTLTASSDATAGLDAATAVASTLLAESSADAAVSADTSVAGALAAIGAADASVTGSIATSASLAATATADASTAGAAIVQTSDLTAGADATADAAGNVGPVAVLLADAQSSAEVATAQTVSASLATNAAASASVAGSVATSGALIADAASDAALAVDVTSPSALDATADGTAEALTTTGFVATLQADAESTAAVSTSSTVIGALTAVAAASSSVSAVADARAALAATAVASADTGVEITVPITLDATASSDAIVSTVSGYIFPVESTADTTASIETEFTRVSDLSSSAASSATVSGFFSFTRALAASAASSSTIVAVVGVTGAVSAAADASSSLDTTSDVVGLLDATASADAGVGSQFEQFVDMLAEASTDAAVSGFAGAVRSVAASAGTSAAITAVVTVRGSVSASAATDAALLNVGFGAQLVSNGEASAFFVQTQIGRRISGTANIVTNVVAELLHVRQVLTDTITAAFGLTYDPQFRPIDSTVDILGDLNGFLGRVRKLSGTVGIVVNGVADLTLSPQYLPVKVNMFGRITVVRAAEATIGIDVDAHGNVRAAPIRMPITFTESGKLTVLRRMTGTMVINIGLDPRFVAVRNLTTVIDPVSFSMAHVPESSVAFKSMAPASETAEPRRAEAPAPVVRTSTPVVYDRPFLLIRD